MKHWPPLADNPHNLYPFAQIDVPMEALLRLGQTDLPQALSAILESLLRVLLQEAPDLADVREKSFIRLGDSTL